MVFNGSVKQNPGNFRNERIAQGLLWMALSSSGLGTVAAPLFPCLPYVIPLSTPPAKRPGLCSCWPPLPLVLRPGLRYRCVKAKFTSDVSHSSCPAGQSERLESTFCLT